MTGILLETYVLHELRAALNSTGVGGTLSYWRTPSGTEVDFVRTRGSRAVGFEVKSASRWRPRDGAALQDLIRQLLVESLLLALAGAAAGCLFAYGGIKLLVPLIPDGAIPREAAIRLNVPVLIFSLGAAVFTAVLFGLAPAWQATKRDLIDPLKDSGKGMSGGFRRGKLRNTLVVVQVFTPWSRTKVPPSARQDFCCTSGGSASAGPAMATSAAAVIAPTSTLRIAASPCDPWSGRPDRPDGWLGVAAGAVKEGGARCRDGGPVGCREP